MKYGKAYALTCLSPIKQGSLKNQSYNVLIRRALQALPLDEASPFANVDNNYVCRLYILNDVFYNPINISSLVSYKTPVHEEHLKSSYLAFLVHFHGSRDDYLRSMWQNMQKTIQDIWQYCVAFEQVKDANSFIAYMKKSEVPTTFPFNGSTDDSLKEQLKSLYLKQEFSKFAFAQQGKNADELQQEFLKFMDKVQIDNLEQPSWEAGKSSL